MHFPRASLLVALCCILAAPLAAQKSNAQSSNAQGSNAQGSNAQDRMPPIPADKLTEAQKKAAEAFPKGGVTRSGDHSCRLSAAPK
jgi:hypothetical protein